MANKVASTKKCTTILGAVHQRVGAKIVAADVRDVCPPAWERCSYSSLRQIWSYRLQAFTGTAVSSSSLKGA